MTKYTTRNNSGCGNRYFYNLTWCLILLSAIKGNVCQKWSEQNKLSICLNTNEMHCVYPQTISLLLSLFLFVCLSLSLSLSCSLSLAMTHKHKNRQTHKHTHTHTHTHIYIYIYIYMILFSYTLTCTSEVKYVYIYIYIYIYEEDVLAVMSFVASNGHTGVSWKLWRSCWYFTYRE